MKTRTGGVIASIFVALALAVGLSACGGGSAKGGDDAAANFTGVWQLESMEGEEGISAEDVQMMAEMDLYITLTLAEDGSAVLDFMGETEAGTWKAKDASTADLVIDGETVEAKLDGGKLKLSQDGTTLVFIKSDLPPSTASASSEADSDEEEVVVEEEVVETDVATSDEVIDVQYGVPFGDDLVTITVIDAGVDWGDDPGYNLKVENLSDQVLKISYKYGTFSVNGKMLSPGLAETVQPGKYVETFMWFDSDEVADVAALVDVEGTLEITTEDWDTLSEIKVLFPDGK